MACRTTGGLRAARRPLLKGLIALTLLTAVTAGGTLAVSLAAGPNPQGAAGRLPPGVPVPETLPAAEAPPVPDTTYRFGVFPYLPTLKIDRIFGPIAASLSRDLGTRVQLRTKPTFEQFAEELFNESYDIIFVHPFFYVDAHDRYGYIPIARLDQPLTAVLMVAEDSPIRDLSNLRGKVVALPPPLAGVSDLAKMALLDAGLDPDRDLSLRYFRTKMSCLQAVTMGAAAACAVPNFLLPQLTSLGDLRLRPLWETPPINHVVYAVHPRVPEEHRQMLRNCILGWPGTAEGRTVMAVGAWTRFVPASDEDYDDVRRYKARLQTLAVSPRHARL